MTRAKSQARSIDPKPDATDAFSELITARQRASVPASFGEPLPERRSISEQVANRILGMIKSGNLRSGDQLPTEAQMTIAFAISRPPLREALKALTIMGVLESRQGGRYTVTNLSPSRLAAPFNVMFGANEYDVDEHFEAHETVDVQLVRLCTERASTETRQRILKLAVDGRAFYHDPVAFRLLDIEFHQSLYTGGKNALLGTLAQVLYDVGLDVRRVASTVPGIIEKSVQQHIEVAEAVLAKNPEAAAAAYHRHLEHVRDSTIQSAARFERPERG